MLESGEGPAIVLVHGLPGCAYDWEPLFERAQPDSKLLRIAGGSHMLPITHADLLAAHLLAFTD